MQVYTSIQLVDRNQVSTGVCARAPQSRMRSISKENGKTWPLFFFFFSLIWILSWLDISPVRLLSNEPEQCWSDVIGLAHRWHRRRKMSARITGEASASNDTSSAVSRPPMTRTTSLPMTPPSPLAVNPWYRQKFEMVETSNGSCFSSTMILLFSIVMWLKRKFATSILIYRIRTNFSHPILNIQLWRATIWIFPYVIESLRFLVFNVPIEPQYLLPRRSCFYSNRLNYRMDVVLLSLWRTVLDLPTPKMNVANWSPSVKIRSATIRFEHPFENASDRVPCRTMLMRIGMIINLISTQFSSLVSSVSVDTDKLIDLCSTRHLLAF